MGSIVEGSQPLRVGGLRVGYRGYTHARAGGKALLAYIDDAHLDRYLAAQPLTASTAHTMCDAAQLKAQLKQIAKQGYAFDREEFTEGVGCVAAPIFSADGKAVSALSVSAPAWRLAQNLEPLAAAVTQAAQQASGILGFDSTSERSQQRERANYKV